MKKTLLLVLTILAFNISKAQVILDSSDVAGPGAEFWIATDDAPDMSIYPGDESVSQDWDFSMLIDVNTDTQYVVYPNQTPYASKFPTAKIAVKDLSEGSLTYTFLNKYVGYLEAVGTVAPNPYNPAQMQVIPFNPPVLSIGFPTQLGTTASDHTKIKVGVKGSDVGQPTIDSVRVTQYAWATTKVNAEGTLTTPYGVFQALRFYEKGYDTTVIDVKYPFIGWTNYQTSNDSSYTYRWWAKGIGRELVEMDYDSVNFTVTQVKWLTSNPVSAKAISKNLTAVYPNPCIDYVAVNGAKLNSEIKLTDMSGRVVRMESASYNNPKIAVSDLNAGVYFIQYTSIDNKTVRSKVVKK